MQTLVQSGAQKSLQKQDLNAVYAAFSAQAPALKSVVVQLTHTASA